MVQEASTRSGRETLPADQQKLMRKAVRLEWITIAVKLVTIPLVGLVAGQSQAMKTAWYEDILELLPPVAFLVAAWTIRRQANAKHPYGHHRDIGVGYLVASFALFAMGIYLLFEGVMSLVHRERPPIGTVVLFGHSIWLGWLMIVVMAVSAAGPVILGRLKLKLVEEFPDKVLYADADMNKAD
ncbi:cation transporter [Corynebacterium aquatimens]|uniref:cation transporter n=2 Tax=Corynebacterium TaxID=1716 RepID=UPI0033139EF5